MTIKLKDKYFKILRTFQGFFFKFVPYLPWEAFLLKQRFSHTLQENTVIAQLEN